jgi:hypothetical protein
LIITSRSCPAASGTTGGCSGSGRAWVLRGCGGGSVSRVGGKGATGGSTRSGSWSIGSGGGGACGASICCNAKSVADAGSAGL